MKRLMWMGVCGMLAGGMVACGEQADESAEANDATESTQVTSYEASLALAATAEAEPGASSEDIASAAAQNAGSVFIPSSCVSAAAEGATVTYELDECTGPLGFATTTGTVVAVYERQGDQLSVDVDGDNLAINDSTVNLDTTSVYSKSGDRVSLQVTTNSDGTTGRGRNFMRSGTYTASWVPGEGCLTLEGTWDTTVGAAEWSTAVTDYTACEGECPKAGGELVWEGKRGASLTLSFDGSDQVSWETGRGRTGTSQLMCGG